MKTLLQEAMFEGLVQSYRNSTDPNLLALIDSINQGDRTALAPLSDYYRAKGEEGKADMFLWCWKRNRWPCTDPKGSYFAQGNYNRMPEHGVGYRETWQVKYDFYFSQETASEKTFGSFELFYSRLWSQCPEHTARLMKELQ